jgi:hypothetical protein
VSLTLKHLLLNRSSLNKQMFFGYKLTISYRKKSINETVLLLTITPNTSHRLIIIRWIPVGIEHNQSIRTNQVQATTTGLR